MRKLLKVFFTLILVLLICAVMIPFLLPLDTYKQEIAARVKDATGRDLVIGGAIRAQLFPTLGIIIEDTSLSNPANFSNNPLLKVKGLLLEVELVPLFSKQIRVTRFVLNEPTINLEINADGKANWQFSSREAPAQTPVSAEKNTSDQNVKSLLAASVLGEVSISDGRISYRNNKTKQALSLNDVNLKTSFSGLRMPFKIEADAMWNEKKMETTLVLKELDALLSGKPSPFAFALNSAPLSITYRGNAALNGVSGDANITIPSLPNLVNWTGGSSNSNGTTPLSFSAKGALACDPTACSFSKSMLALDAINAKGDLWFGFSGKPNIEATLAIDTLDINPYLSKTHAQRDWLVSAAYAMEPWSNEKIDLSGLRAVNAKINISAGRLLYNKIKVGRNSLSLSLQNGALTASMPNAEFYGGAIKSDSKLDASGAFSKQVTISNVDAESFLRDATDSDRFSGTMNMAINTSGTLTSIRGMITSLNGNGNVKLSNGAIKGVDLASMARNVQSAFREVDTSQKKTDFSELGGTFTIARGIVSNNDLAIKAPFLRLSGGGTVDLPAQTISYRLVPEIVKTAQGQGGKEKQGLEVPIIVSGPLDQPNFTPDVAGIAQKVLENPEAIKETVKDVKEQIKENRAVFKDLLQGFTKKKAKEPEVQNPAATEPAPQNPPVAEPAAQ